MVIITSESLGPPFPTSPFIEVNWNGNQQRELEITSLIEVAHL